MVRVFNNLKEIEKYYNKETDTYIFRGKNFVGKVILNFDLNIESNIEAHNVRGTSITAKNIHALNISAWEINAYDIESRCIDVGVIRARDIYTSTIEAMDIYARDINATFGIDAINIYARDIVYTASCSAYEDFKCNSIKCGHQIPLHYSLYGKLEVTEDDQSIQ